MYFVDAYTSPENIKIYIDIYITIPSERKFNFHFLPFSNKIIVL